VEIERVTDRDTAFVADMVELGRAAEHNSDEFLHDVVRRLHDRQPAWDWVGIYLLVGDTLVLGPYIGEPTEHVSIPVGVGVCGTAVQRDTNMLVEDVRAQDNYLACSLHTRSELVVLIRDRGELVGQFDIDSDQVGAFGPRDEQLLERLAAGVSAHCRAARDARSAQITSV
jgi:L-methionine (R)-S-oxide reductase